MISVTLTDRTPQALAAVAAAARRGVVAAALAIRNEAQRSIRSGPKTGRLYTMQYRRIRGRVVPIGPRQGANLSPSHRASAPGQAPATDTGNLASRIALGDLTKDPLRPRAQAGVAAGAPYAIHLELGAPRARLLPRPFLAKALAKLRPQLLARIEAAIRAGLREGGAA